MMREMTVQEFAQEVKNMTMEIMPEEFEGVMAEMSQARVRYDEEDEELIFYTGDYNHGGNASMTIKTEVVESIYKDEDGYHFTLNNDVTFYVSETPVLSGGLNDLLDKPSHHQCELARALTKSTAEDKQITDDILSMKKSVWYTICKSLDEILKEHSEPFNIGQEQMLKDFRKVAGMNRVDEASVCIAYMSWKHSKKAEK